MATAKKAATKGNQVVPIKKTAVAAPRAAMGRGFEEADVDSFAIPFLVLLQKTSPAADADDPAYVKGAKAGMFMNTVTQELYENPEIIPCVYQRRFNRWAPLDSGGGFKGTFLPSVISGMEAKSVIAQDDDGRWYFTMPDGTISEKKSDVLTDTRLHYCMMVQDDGSLVNVLVSLSRTQLKKSKNWMTLMQQQGGDMWDNVYALSSKQEENDKGKWMGWVINSSRSTEDEERAAAEAFYESVQSGAVKVRMDKAED